MTQTDEQKKRYAKLHEELEPNMIKAGAGGKYKFDIMSMDKINYGPHYSTGEGVGIKGEKIQLLMVTKVKGTGAILHTHPNEQFCFVVEGRLAFRVEDVEDVAEKHQLVYIPANARHYTRATETEDVIYLASKDRSYFISGDPVDPSQEGGYFGPGTKKS